MLKRPWLPVTLLLLTGGRACESLRRHKAIPEAEAQEALKEVGAELRGARQRLAALRGE